MGLCNVTLLYLEISAVCMFILKLPTHVPTETSDDILAKYRKKSILTSTPSSEPTQTEREKRLSLKAADDETPLYDPSNLEKCLAFLDAKRKLRIVLSTADCLVGAELCCVFVLCQTYLGTRSWSE